MDSSWLVVIIPFITAGAGAYLGSYLKKKGENLATHEDIDRLVDQVAAVTKVTKEIESKVSSDLWDRQKQWELKRDILLDGAKKMSDVQSKLLSLNTYWRAKLNNEIDGDESKIRLEHEYVTNWRTSFKSFEDAISLTRITCSAETMMIFAELRDLLRSIAAKIVNGDVSAYQSVEGDRNTKIARASVAIRKELGILLKPMINSVAGDS